MRIKVIVCIAIMVLLAACTGPEIIERLTRYNDEGQIIEQRDTKIKGSSDAVSPAVIVDYTATGGVSRRAEAPASQPTDQALSDLSGWAGWIGGGLILVGAASIVLRFFLPVIPLVASVSLLGIGAGVLAMPMMLDRYLWWFAAGAGVYVALYLWGIKDNQNKIRMNQIMWGQAGDQGRQVVPPRGGE